MRSRVFLAPLAFGFGACVLSVALQPLARQPAQAAVSRIRVERNTTGNPYPFNQGDTFNYNYSETHSVEQPGKARVLSSATGTIVTTIGASTTFNGHQATDVNNVLTYTDFNNNQQQTATGTTTTDDYEAFVTSGNFLDYELYGYTSSGTENETNGIVRSSSETQTDASPFLLDRLPETRGDSWQDTAGYTLASQVATTVNGNTTTTTSTYTRKPNGAYMLTSSNSNGYQETANQNANGSARDQNNGTGKTAGTTTFSAPKLVSGQYVIVVKYTPPTGPSTTTNVPDWFPGNGPVQHLVTDTFADLGGVKVPAKCGTTAGMQAVELRESLSFLDALKGSYSAETVDKLVVFGMGVVCVIHQREISTYDDRDTGALTATEHTSALQALTSESQNAIRTRGFIRGFTTR